MSGQAKYTQFLLQLADLGCSLQLPQLRDSARALLNIMPADQYTGTLVHLFNSANCWLNLIWYSHAISYLFSSWNCVPSNLIRSQIFALFWSVCICWRIMCIIMHNKILLIFSTWTRMRLENFFFFFMYTQMKFYCHNSFWLFDVVLEIGNILLVVYDWDSRIVSCIILDIKYWLFVLYYLLQLTTFERYAWNTRKLETRVCHHP